MIGNSLIVGGGIQSGSPFGLGHLVYVTNVSPPQLTSFAPTVVTDTLSSVVYLNVPNSVATSVPTNQNASETIRIKGGLIVEGAGTNSIQIGRGATATQTDTIAIGRGSGATITKSTIVGSNSNDNGSLLTCVGWGSGALSSSGVAIGMTAVIQGNAGGSSGIAIGDNTLAQNSSTGGGVSIAIGTNANARTNDIVIGGNAASSTQSVFGNFNVVIGDTATANIAGGGLYCVVIGATAVSTQKLAVVLGGGARATAAAGQTRSVVVGNGSTSTATDAIVVGGGSALTTKSIAIGAGAVELGVGWLQLGAAGTPITTVNIGAGNTIATPAAKTIRFTNASGNDNAAGDVTIQIPISTGGAVPAGLIISGSAVAGSSSTLQPVNAIVRFGTNAGSGGIATMAFQQNVARIVGGPTSLALRNNADNADNILIADAGTITLRSLAGTGSRAVIADANGVLSAP